MKRQRWISISAAAAAAGGGAWLVKFPVVAATQEDALGASILYVLGITLLFAGSTWVGAKAAGDRGRAVLAVLVLLSPLAFWMSYTVLDGLALAVLGDGAASWLEDELGILATGAVWLAASLWGFRPRHDDAAAHRPMTA